MDVGQYQCRSKPAVHASGSLSQQYCSYWNGQRRLIIAALFALIIFVVAAMVFNEQPETFLTLHGESANDRSATPNSPLAGSVASVTLVTAYYPVSQGSRHKLEEYRRWMANFLPHVRANLVVYLPLDGELEGVVRDLRGDLPLVVRVCSTHGRQGVKHQWPGEYVIAVTDL